MTFGAISAEQGDKGYGEIAQKRVLPAAPAHEQHRQDVHIAVDAAAEYGPGVVERAGLVLIQPRRERGEGDEPQDEAQRKYGRGAGRLRPPG